MNNKVLVLIKPDAIQRGMVGEIIKRFENKGFKIIRMNVEIPSLKKIAKHYKEHSGKDFCRSLVKYMSTNGEIVSIVFLRENAIDVARNVILKRIREDFALENPCNSIHASDSQESFVREFKIWFGDK